MTLTKAGHFFVAPLAGWGHVRPLLHLTINLLKVHPGLHLSLLVVPSVSGRIDKELASNFSKDAALDRVQIIKVSSSVADDTKVWNGEYMAAEAMEFANTLPLAVKALYGKGELPGGKENKFGEIKPTFGMYDAFHDFVPESVEAVSKELGMSIPPLFAFVPCNALAMHQLLTKDAYTNNIQQMVKALTDQGMDLMEAHTKVGYGFSGRVVNIPGMKPIYDYELIPQDTALPLPPHIHAKVCKIRNVILHPATTALVLPVVQEFEEECHEAIEKEIGKQVVQCGMQFPNSTWQGVKAPRNIKNAEDERVLTFLDDMQTKFGDRSVAYVSFGSAFFPFARPELAIWLIESLVENNVPLLFAYASDFAPIPQAILDAVKTSSTACSVKFAPQWQVLEHPATRFFVSHCGSNSTAEAMVTGVPIVAMPFGADQAEFAYLVTNAGAGIQLKQVSSFANGWNKLYDGTEIIGTEEAIKTEMKGVWEQVMGKKGDEMRENMLQLRAVAKKSHEDGESRKAMESFSAYF